MPREWRFRNEKGRRKVGGVCAALAQCGLPSFSYRNDCPHKEATDAFAANSAIEREIAHA
jgi:hypothetical protein